MFKRLLYCVMLWVLIPMMSEISAAEVYVAQGGDNSDGSSWEKGFNSIQAAVNVASAGDTVWVDGGVYAESNSLSSSSNSYDWSKVLNIPPGSHCQGGNQILHFKPSNKPFSNNPETIFFVNNTFQHAQALTSDAEVLRFASDKVEVEGKYIELGVCTGKTINFIAALNPLKQIYGFDSFEGLPEDWVRNDKTFSKGTFAFKDPTMLPPVLHNVELIKGWFKDTLPLFVQETLGDEQIAFLHVDSDIYSAAAEALSTFKDNIRPGTIIVFDEFYNYPGCENHEIKALEEFLEKMNFKAEYLAYNIYHEQVAMRIEEKKEAQHL